MQIIGVTELVIGSLLMAYCAVELYRALIRFKESSYSATVFSRPIFSVSMILTVLFHVVYVALAIRYFLDRYWTWFDLVVCTVLLCGAFFGLTVIMVQNQMLDVIRQKADELVLTLVGAIEAKDPYTRGHSIHVSKLAELLYSHLPDSIRNKVNYINLRDASILHDIGKIGISDQILNKPDKLTQEEWMQVRKHPRVGMQILEQTSFSELGDIILCHHERLDQEGYYRVPADQIPLESKIIAITDTFSALYSDRVYRPRRSYEDAISILREAAGTQLDPELVEIFCSIPEKEIKALTTESFSAASIKPKPQTTASRQ